MVLAQCPRTRLGSCVSSLVWFANSLYWIHYNFTGPNQCFMNSRTVWTLNAVSHIETRILTEFWPVLGPIWCWIEKKILKHNVILNDLSWPIYISQKHQPSNAYTLGNAVFVHFCLVFTRFQVDLIQFFVKNCSRYHIFSSGDHVQAVGLKNRY